MIYIEIVFLSLVPYVLTDVLQVGIRAEGPVAMTSDGSFQVFQVADVGAAVAGIEESLYLVVGSLLGSVLIECLPLAGFRQEYLGRESLVGNAFVQLSGELGDALVGPW